MGLRRRLPLFRALVREKDIIDGDYHIHWLEDFLARGGMPVADRTSRHAGKRNGVLDRQPYRNR